MEKIELAIEYQLAADFSRGLNEYLTEDKMAEVIARNATEAYQDGACATHDFCDANVFMLEAFQKVLGREYTFYNSDIEGSDKENENDTCLWNKAWEIARDNNFKSLLLF